MAPLHSTLGDRGRLHLKQNKTKNAKFDLQQNCHAVREEDGTILRSSWRVQCTLKYWSQFLNQQTKDMKHLVGGRWEELSMSGFLLVSVSGALC